MCADPKVSIPSRWSSLQMSTKLLTNRHSNDRVRDGHINSTNSVNRVVNAIFDGAMVENHVSGRTHIESTLPRIRLHIPLPHTKIPNNNIALSTRRYFPSHYTNSRRRRRLSIDSGGAGERN